MENKINSQFQLKLKELLSKRLSTKKGLLIIILMIVLLTLLISLFQVDTHRLTTSFLGSEEKAVLSVSPESGTYGVGEEFTVDVLVNTKGENVVAVGAYLNYDSAKFRLVNINTDNSVFNTNNSCVYNGRPCEIINSDTPGQIEIVKAKPSPGVNTNNGLVAQITFQAIEIVEPNEDNLTFTFTAPYASGDSEVILDDAQGTDILSGVDNARFTVQETESFKARVRLERRKTLNSELTFYFLEEGTQTVIYQFSCLSNTNGHCEADISLANLPSGTYDLRVKAPGYLTKKIESITWPTETEIEIGELVAGNLQDEDNEINSLDWSIMNGLWGSSDPKADINQDGLVNALDWSIMNKNWGKAGE